MFHHLPDEIPPYQPMNRTVTGVLKELWSWIPTTLTLYGLIIFIYSLKPPPMLFADSLQSGLIKGYLLSTSCMFLYVFGGRFAHRILYRQE
jgi:hypothetical protein